AGDAWRAVRPAAGPANVRSVVGVLAEGAAEPDGGPAECGDEVCGDAPAGEPGMGARGRRWGRPFFGWRGFCGECARGEGEGWPGRGPVGQLDRDLSAARTRTCR